MNKRMSIRSFGLGASVLIAIMAGSYAADAVTPKAAALNEAIQVLADLTAIDVDCRDLAVNFGIGFRYASDQGLAAAAILPAGPKRPIFETALNATQVNYGAAIVCGALAHHYSVMLPGSVTFPATSHDGS